MTASLAKRERLVVNVVCPHDPHDATAWSGIPFFLLSALERRNIVCKDVSGAARSINPFFHRIAHVLEKLGLRLNVFRTTFFSWVTGAITSTRLLFAPRGPVLVIAGSNEGARLFTSRFKIYVSDATQSAFARLYSDLNDLPGWNLRQGDRNERLALTRSDAVIVPSTWASESAHREYGVRAERLHVIPFGVNLTAELVEQHFKPKQPPSPDAVKLLFIAADWQRKNGALLLDICRLLISRGIKAKATLIGDVPECHRSLPFVDYKGRLDKRKPDDLVTMCKAYAAADFFVMPTTAEAFGIVFSEAQSFGVPSLTFDVGGTSTAVADGVTGTLLPLGADAGAFADVIQGFVANPKRYLVVSQNCRERYKTQSNWDNWAECIARLAGL